MHWAIGHIVAQTIILYALSNIGLCNAIKAIPQCIDRNPSSHTIKETNTYHAGLGNSLCVNRILGLYIYSNTHEDFPLWYSFAFYIFNNNNNALEKQQWFIKSDIKDQFFAYYILLLYLQTWKISMAMNLSLPDKLFSCKKFRYLTQN